MKILFVVKSAEMLEKLLFGYKALETVFEVIFSGCELAEMACNGLTIMAENLGIKIPSEDETLSKIIPEEFV